MKEKLRILNLEDNRRDADLNRETLLDEGMDCELIREETREAFLAAIEQGTIDIILADYTLPEFDGLSALELARAHCPEVPFLFVSGTLGEEIAVEALKNGARDYVLKERLGRLPASVRTVLEKKRLEKVEVEAREALEKAAREWINTFDAVSNFIALVDCDGKVQRCNRAMQGLLNRPLPEILGLPLQELFSVSFDESEGYPLQRALKSGHRESRVIEFEQRWFRVHVDPVSESGEAGGFVFIMADITERRQAETELRESEERFRLLVEQAPEAIAVFDVDENRFIQVNAQAEKLFGCSQEELLKYGPQRFYGPLQPDGQPVANSLEENIKAVVDGEDKVIERIIHNAQGRELICEVRLVPLPSKNRKLIRNSFVDITIRKMAEETLKTSEARYRRLYESMADAYVMTDLEGRIKEYNQSYRTMLGYEDEELLSLRYKDLIPEKWHAFEDEIVEKDVFIKGSTSVYEKEYRKKDGTVFPVELRTFLLKDEKGKPSHFCAIVRDITDRRKMEEERENLQTQFLQAQKLESVGRLAGGVAHDFNNLLSVINGYSELALNKLEEGDPLRADLQEIRQASGRAATLTRQLLAFSRKQILTPVVLNLNGVISSVGKMFQRLIGEDVEVKTILAGDLGMINADIGQLEQVLMNLSVNARDAMPRGGKLTLETRNLTVDQHLAARHPEMAPGPHILLTVSDTGTGMDQETQKQIFEPFFTTKEQGQGTGLGLSTVYGIVKQSSGYIEVTSEPGMGTTFRIYLPRVPGIELERPTDPAVEPRWEGKETVLVVEDEKSLRLLAGEFLTSVGYRVLYAADGMEALKLVQQTRESIDLLLTDVVMPKMSGPELADRLCLLQPELKVLYMSGYATETLTHHLGSGEDLRLINKPFERAGLLEQVRKVLDS